MELTNNIQLSIVVPVYKEEHNIHPFLIRMIPVLKKMDIRYEIIFCLDPSPDNTETVILDEIKNNSSINLITFSRRFGQPAATMAGILTCQGNACVVIDVDLQDPPELIPELYEKLQQNYEVVYAKRRSRQGETVFKRMISYWGYSLINRLSEVEIPRNTGDFRIMSRRVIEELRRLNESHGFLRGLVAYVGFKQTFIEYDRDQRFSGKGNYNQFLGSLKIGLNGLIGFSSRPLQFMSIVGALTSVLSFFLGLSYLIQKTLGVQLTPGLSSTIIVVTFFSGVQLLCLGVVGEYISRIYDEVKKRPMFIIDKIVKNESQKKIYSQKQNTASTQNSVKENIEFIQ